MKFFAHLLLAVATAAGAQTLTVPADQLIVLKAEARGAQIYKCTADGDAAKWVFQGPDADLYVDGLGVGTHGAGPVWTYKDGSSVSGTVLSTTPSPDKTAIPWLLLRGGGVGSGLLHRVTYITRTETSGGTVEGELCGLPSVGTILRKPYRATYTFYAPLK